MLLESLTIPLIKGKWNDIDKESNCLDKDYDSLDSFSNKHRDALHVWYGIFPVEC